MPILNSTLPKKLNGFILYLRPEMPSVYIYINEPYSPSFMNDKYYKIHDFTFEPNYEYNFILYKTEVNKLGPPYSQCYNKDVLNEFALDRTIIKFFQLNNMSHKQKDCNQLCSELDFINTNPCNCRNA